MNKQLNTYSDMEGQPKGAPLLKDILSVVYDHIRDKNLKKKWSCVNKECKDMYITNNYNYRKTRIQIPSLNHIKTVSSNTEVLGGNVISGYKISSIPTPDNKTLKKYLDEISHTKLHNDSSECVFVAIGVCASKYKILIYDYSQSEEYIEEPSWSFSLEGFAFSYFILDRYTIFIIPDNGPAKIYTKGIENLNFKCREYDAEAYCIAPWTVKSKDGSIRAPIIYDNMFRPIMYIDDKRYDFGHEIISDDRPPFGRLSTDRSRIDHTQVCEMKDASRFDFHPRSNLIIWHNLLLCANRTLYIRGGLILSVKEIGEDIVLEYKGKYSLGSSAGKLLLTTQASLGENNEFAFIGCVTETPSGKLKYTHFDYSYGMDEPYLEYEYPFNLE